MVKPQKAQQRQTEKGAVNDMIESYTNRKVENTAMQNKYMIAVEIKTTK